MLDLAFIEGVLAQAKADPQFIIPSPCQNICVMQEGLATPLCAGCLRTSDEITNWWDKSESEKREIFLNLASRLDSIWD